MGAPGWLSQLSTGFLISTWVMILGFWDWALHLAPHWVWSLLEILSLSFSLCLCLCLSLSQPLSPAHMLSLSLSLSNKKLTNRKPHKYEVMYCNMNIWMLRESKEFGIHSLSWKNILEVLVHSHTHWRWASSIVFK